MRLVVCSIDCQEGWDGPALLVFSFGKKVSTRLDRNGLQPARYWQKDDGTIYVASEVSMLNDILDSAPNVITKGRIGPGQMVVADLGAGTFMENEDVAKEVGTDAQYGEWLEPSTKPLASLPRAATHMIRARLRRSDDMQTGAFLYCGV